MSNALQRQNENLKSRLRSLRGDLNAASVGVMADGAALIAAYAVGKAEASNSLPGAPWDLDPELFYGAVAKGGAFLLDGEAAMLADSLGQSLLTVYAYKSGKGE